MVNDVVLVGRIKDFGEEINNKREIMIEVERPFNETIGRVYDVFVCRLWTSIFSKVLRYSNIGDMLAIKGRIINEDSKYFVIAENVVILNKYKDNILK